MRMHLLGSWGRALCFPPSARVPRGVPVSPVGASLSRDPGRGVWGRLLGPQEVLPHDNPLPSQLSPGSRCQQDWWSLPPHPHGLQPQSVPCLGK